MHAAVRLKVLIVDDEPPARERLRSLLAELADVEVVGEAVSGAEALSQSQTSPPTWCCSTCACRAWTGWKPRAT